MTDDRPAPPREIPDDVVRTVEELDPNELRRLARYATDLADGRERDARDEDEAEPDDASEDLPDDVPPKATVTVKEINDNRYDYWQWREGDQIKSQYKGPVDPDD